MIPVQCYTAPCWVGGQWHGYYREIVMYRVSREVMLEHFSIDKALLFNFVEKAACFTPYGPCNVKASLQEQDAIYVCKDLVNKKWDCSSLGVRDTKMANYLNSRFDLQDNELVPFDHKGNVLELERTEITTHQLPKKLVKDFCFLALCSKAKLKMEKRLSQFYREGKVETSFIPVPTVVDDGEPLTSEDWNLIKDIEDMKIPVPMSYAEDVD